MKTTDVSFLPSPCGNLALKSSFLTDAAPPYGSSDEPWPVPMQENGYSREESHANEKKMCRGGRGIIYRDG